MNRNIKMICCLGVGIALYVALSATVKIPLISHIQTDLGYIVFGAFCVWLGWKGLIVGAVGCMLESLIFSGWFPVGWIAGQILIGLICGISYRALKDKSNWIKYVVSGLITVAAVFIGVAIIKTVIECAMFAIPFEAKMAKNSIAFVADTVPMILGMIIGHKLNNKIEGL